MTADVGRIARAVWPALAGALAGLAAGAIWTLAQPDRYRADALVLVRGGTAGSTLPAVKALAESSLLEQNVAQTLHLAHPARISAKAGKGGILTVSVEAGSRDRARQIDAEAVVVLTQKIAQRFGSSGVDSTGLDSAHAAEQTSPTPARNLLILGLIGLAAGTGVAAGLRRQRPAPAVAGAVDPAVERRLQARLDQVAKRERELAKRAGELSARKRAFEELVAEERRRPRPPPEPARAPEPEPEPEPESEPVLEPMPVVIGAWTIEELERRVREHREAFPHRAEEWDTYLFLLREHADIDGSLPQSFDSLVIDVFGELLS